MPTRREFLASATVALPFGSRLTAAAEDRVPVVDTHLHCFAGKGDARFPYHKAAPYTPDEPATPEHLPARMKYAGVASAVVVHPDPSQDAHRSLEHCLGVGKGKLKGTCLFFAQKEDAPGKLKELAKKLPLVTVRVHAYNPDRLPPF